MTLPGSEPRTRILVVEDELPMRRTLDIGLRARGYEVDLAANGEEALELARLHHPAARATRSSWLPTDEQGSIGSVKMRPRW